MARPAKDDLNVFGPSLLHTIERGDVFRIGRDRRARILVVTGKIYHEDLSVSYTFDVLGGYKRTATISEKTFGATSQYRRIYRTKRKLGAWNSEKQTA